MRVRRTLARATMFVVAVTLVMCPWSPAAADGGSLLIDAHNDQAGFVQDPTLPLVQADHLIPGTSTASDFDVRNTADGEAVLRLTATGVTDDENGCLRAEAQDSQEDCSVDVGELSGWLRGEVIHHTGAGDEVLWQGPFTDLTSGVLLTRHLPANSTWPMTLRLSVPIEAGNAIMTDTVRYGLRLDAIDVLGEEATSHHHGGTEVLGEQAHAPVPFEIDSGLNGGPQIGLPLTDRTIGLWLLLFDLFVPLSALALMLARLLAHREQRRAD